MRKKRQNHFSCIEILEKKKKIVNLYLFESYTCQEYQFWKEQNWKFFGKESRTTLLCHDGTWFSYDCWLLSLVIIKKTFFDKKTQNLAVFQRQWHITQLKTAISDYNRLLPHGNCLLHVGTTGDEFLTVQPSSACSKDDHLFSVPPSLEPTRPLTMSLLYHLSAFVRKQCDYINSQSGKSVNSACLLV